MAEDEPGTIDSPSHRLSEPSNVSGNKSHERSKLNASHRPSKPNVFITFIRAVFGYRKTSVTLFVFLTIISTLLLVELSNSINFSVKLPTNTLEKTILNNSWLDLQKIGKMEHPYSSRGNDYVHDYLETRISKLMEKKSSFIEYDNDMNYTNNVIFKTEYELFNQVTYYESNNLLVRINGTDSMLPALLVSAHFDSVPSSFGVTDDGMGVASLLGILNYYSSDEVDQPMRTIILNFNNNEEFGLMGATSFLHHPWFKQIRYFLNLEGTGAGGKAALFRGTDYGIVKYFKHVRYPFGTSLFQQGFNNHLIHSETDYKVYKENGGIRGLDLAFYKPRDLYHTASDSMKNIDIKSLWHMLSNSLDFVEVVSSQRIDLDDEGSSPESDETSREFAIFSSFFNWFFVIPISKLVLINATCLAVIPLISFPLLVIIFHYKKNWHIGFINAIKFPVSLGLSICILNITTHNFIASINEFLPTSSYGSIVSTLYAIFLLLNYLFLNGVNFIFKGYKGLYHDEKLILIIQTSFIYWVLLLVSTVKLSNNNIGHDHTGEFPIIMLFLLQSIGALFGLLSWSFKNTKHYDLKNDDDEACQALLSHEQHNNNYGSNELEASEPAQPMLSNSSVSLNSSLSQATNNLIKNLRKSFSYDWSIQYIVIVPLSSLIIYNTGSLLLSGLNKSIQESLNAENLVFDLIQLVAIALAIPFLPFIFKINRLLVTALILVLCLGFTCIFLTPPFDQLNPLKLRFVQSVNLDESSDISVVNVFGRYGSPMGNILSDLPSIKESNESLECNHLQDGMQVCSYKSLLQPHLSPDVTDFNDYLDIQILKNSSSDYPYGLLSGEIKINVPENRACRLAFNNSNFENSKQSLVRTILVYDDNNYKNSSSSSFEISEFQLASLPEGFSRDKKGTYIFKNLNGIDNLALNKLSWDKPYRVGFQWMPKFVDSENENEYYPNETDFNKLGIHIECFWGDLGYDNHENEINERIPAYGEVLHYSPNYVSWANKDSGLVSVLKYVEI